MAQRSARQTALAALRLWRKEKCFADSIISGLPAKAELTPSDRAFALELFYGVLRNLTLLDFWIGCLRLSRIESDVRDILRLGFYQLFLLETPEHAAVHETVTLAPQKQRPVVNGVLRTATRRSKRVARTDRGRQPLSVRMSHPQFLVDTLAAALWRRDTPKRSVQLEQPACADLRANQSAENRPNQFLRLYPNSRPLAQHSCRRR